MGAAAGGSGTRDATLGGEARRIVEDLLATLGPSDEILLVPYDRAPRPVTARPSSDLGRVRAATQALAPGGSGTDHVQALEFAARALGQSRALNRELFWISDFQSAGFARAGADPPASIQAPDGPWSRARTYLVPLAPPSRANVGLSDARSPPPRARSRSSVSARSYGAHPGDLAVEVRDATRDAELGRGFLDVPERGEASTLLPLARVPDDGGVATIPDDALALDNRRVFPAGRAGTVTVLLREDGPPSALRLALEAGAPASGIAAEAVDAASLPSRLADADALVLNDLDRLGSAELQTVLDFYRAGGGLLIVLGVHADPAFWNGALLREIGAGTVGEVMTAPANASWRLIRAVAGHPVLAGFASRPGEPLSSARFQSIRAFTAASGTRTLLEFDRAHPALVEAPRALVFATSLDPSWSDFPVSGAFLPLVHQTVKVLGRGTAAGTLEPGDRYSAPAATRIWRIEDEQGREIPSELVAERGSTRLLSAELERTGLYRVLQGGKLRNTFAVNPDPRESDLTAMPERALVAAFPRAGAGAQAGGGSGAAGARSALRSRAVDLVPDPRDHAARG